MKGQLANMEEVNQVGRSKVEELQNLEVRYLDRLCIDYPCVLVQHDRVKSSNQIKCSSEDVNVQDTYFVSSKKCVVMETT